MRPISLLAFPGKLLEKFVDKQLFAHLKYHKLLFEKQHGFTSCKSTSTAIIDLMFFACDDINRKQVCNGIYVDLPKAFDMIKLLATITQTKKLWNFGKIMFMVQVLFR